MKRMFGRSNGSGARAFVVGGVLAALLCGAGYAADGEDLISAAADGKTDVVKALIAQGADLNKANSGGWTPINSAVGKGHAEVVKLLIAAGADVNKASNDGWTPLNNAADEGHAEVVKLLIVAGADLNKANSGGWTPISRAAG